MGFVLRYSIFISSFAMAWFRMCSILRDGLTSNVFHPLWWFDYGCVPSFVMVCLIFGFFFGLRLPLPDKSSGSKTAILCESVSPLPCSLAHKTWVICILFYSSSPCFFNRRFLGFDSFGVRSPLAFWVYSMHFFWPKVSWLRLVFGVGSPLAFECIVYTFR